MTATVPNDDGTVTTTTLIRWVGRDHVRYELEVKAGPPCRLCGQAVTSGDPQEYPYCRDCHYVGAASTDARAEQIAYFRGVLGPGWQVAVEHTGGGCFWLAFYPPGGDPDMPYIATDGDASLPHDDDGRPVRDGWLYVGREGYVGDAQVGVTLVERDAGDPMTDADVCEVILADLDNPTPLEVY